MSFDQRTAEPRTARAPGRPWRPADTPLADGRLEPAAGDRYVAVDRIDGTVVTLAVAPWPLVDGATGRLDFGPVRNRVTRTATADRLQRRVDQDRAERGQLRRPLRVGDVFLVRGLAGPPSRWAAVVDLTRASRLAAKAALFATAAPAPLRDELRTYGLDRRAAGVVRTTDDEPSDPEEPPPGPIAYPAI